MRRWKALAILVVALGLAVGVAACGGDDGGEATPETTEATEPAETEATEPATTEEEPPATTEEEPPPEEGPQAGGTYRVEWEETFGFTGGFDPTGEYLGEGMGIMSNLLVRTLVGYRHTAGAAGNELIPDLATDLGTISDDGLTYTYTLKDGIKFGPPLSREITSQDVAYAFERIATESLVAQYGFYYSVVEGMAEFTAGEADTVSGITTPDDKTIVFQLTAPTGDFPYRLAMPAAGPVPREVGSCFDEAGVYGRYLISSGPYMFEGSDALDASSCDTLEPISGFDPNSSMILVRNPDYDPASDTTDGRENFPDRFEIRINSNPDDIFNKVKAGEIEEAIASEPPKVIREYMENEELTPNMHINAGDRTWYISLNLTQPPFDDIHVRKAVNLVMDKEGLRRAWGGETSGEIATHVIPDSMLNETLADYDPYPSEGYAGDVAAAMEEMKLSKYDTDKDGICDVPECKDVLYVTEADRLRQDMQPPTSSSLEKIGITLKVRSIEGAYPVIQDVSKNIPAAGRPGWGKDYADASTFMVLFDSRSTLPTGNINYSLVGLTPEQAKKVKASGTIEGIPSVDADIDACNLVPVGDERVQCWAELDKKIMEEVVPWIPYLDANAICTTSANVTNWDFDQFSGTLAWSRVAVAN